MVRVAPDLLLNNHYQNQVFITTTPKGITISELNVQLYFLSLHNSLHYVSMA